jgi:hypothetical protein
MIVPRGGVAMTAVPVMTRMLVRFVIVLRVHVSHRPLIFLLIKPVPPPAGGLADVLRFQDNRSAAQRPG